MIARRIAGRAGGDTDETPEYWVTYSDLLVSLLMVFALLLFLTLSKMQKDKRGVQSTVAANKKALALAAGTLDSTGGSVRFDLKTQSVKMDAAVLFDFGSSQLKPGGQAALASVATRYFSQLLTDTATASRIQDITIEGHTDTIGTYMSNMDLSQRRAFSVMRAIVEATYGARYAPRLRSVITANGKSEVEPVYVNGVYNAALSRRIEIRIHFRNDELLERLLGTGPDSVVQ